MEFTRVENKLFDDWMPRLESGEWKVLSFIARKTAGWHKKQDRISLRQTAKATGLSLHGVTVAVAGLEVVGVLDSEPVGQDKVYRIRPNPVPPAMAVGFATVSQRGTGCIPAGYRTVSQRDTTKEKKETLQKKDPSQLREVPDEIDIAMGADVSDAPRSSAKTEKAKAAGKEKIEDNSFPRPLPHWMVSDRDVPGVVFRVPKLTKFGGAHPRATLYLGDVRVTIWKSDLIARLEAAEGKLLVGVGRWTLYEGNKEFVITSIARQSAEDIAALITGQPAPAKTELAIKPATLSPDDPLVVENVAHMRKFPQTRKTLESVLKDPTASEIMKASARVLLAEMPPEVKPPAPVRRAYQECPF